MLVSTTKSAPAKVPATAFGLFIWQLHAWDSQKDKHPSFVIVEVYRGPAGVYEGWIMPANPTPTEQMICCAYISGWLNGRDSKP